MTKAVDLYVLYRFIKAIATPFDETPAFDLGIVDKKGKLLKKPKSKEEKDAYDHFTRFTFNIKRILARVGLDRTYATYAGALLLMKEGAAGIRLSDIEIEEALLENFKYLRENSDKSFNLLKDEIANTTGAAVAGTGDDPVHWGKPKGRKPVLGRGINGLTYLRRRNKKKKDEAKAADKINEVKRIPRKKGQPAGSKKHSDLYTDENPEGTIHGLKFATVKDAEASVTKIRNSNRTHAHKIQAAIAMEQRAKAAGKKSAAAVYRTYINQMKEKTKRMRGTIKSSYPRTAGKLEGRGI